MRFGRSLFRAMVTVVALTAGAAAAPPLTVVFDTLYKADGTRFDGVLQIEWRSFEASDTSHIPQQGLSVQVRSGNFRVQLVPTTTALQSAYYQVKYSSSGRTQFIEYWSVPPSSIPLRIRDVRTTPPGGVTAQPPGSTVSVITDITGLRNELDVRPPKGATYQPSRTAYINSTGALDAVAGSATDCVRVDGSAAPCGTGASGTTFVEGETPAGIANGVNTQFTLSAVPVPAASTALFRNGVLMRQTTDYTISGLQVTFQAGSTPAAGDVLQTWYRTGIADMAYVDGETPAGVVNGINTTFAMANAPTPGGSLRVFRNGLLMKNGLDYTLSGSTISFVAGAVPTVGDVLQAWYRK